MNDPRCRNRDVEGHVCFDSRGDRYGSEGGECFFEIVARLADKSHTIAEHSRTVDVTVAEFANHLATYVPPKGDA